MITHCHKCGAEIERKRPLRTCVCAECYRANRIICCADYRRRIREAKQDAPDPLDMEYPQRVIIPPEYAVHIPELLAEAYKANKRMARTCRRARLWLREDWPLWAAEVGVNMDYLERVGA